MKLCISALFSLIMLLNSCNLKKDQSVKFTKMVFNLNVPNQKIEFDKWVKVNLSDNVNDSISNRYKRNAATKDTLIDQSYEDGNYRINGYCRGEWGGFVEFFNKKKKKFYKMESTCPLLIDFREGQYYVLASLAHGDGFTSIKMVENPEKLTDSTGYKLLLDTFSITANQFFPYKKDNYLIFINENQTLLGKYNNNKIITVDTILNRKLPAQPFMNYIKNGIYVNEIYRHITWGLSTETNRHEKTTGWIYVKKDTIVVGYQYKEWFANGFDE